MAARLIAMMMVLVTLTGCFELTERVSFEKDGSGTVTTNMIVPLSMLIELMMMGDEGITREEAAEAVMAEQMQTMPDMDDTQVGPGMTFKGGEVGYENESMVVRMAIGFDSIASASNLLPGDDESPGAPLVRVPISAGGKNVKINGSPYDSMAELQDPETAAMMEMMGADAKLTYEIEAPHWKLKKHDAHEVDGDVLRWSFTMAEVGKSPKISAQYKR